MLQLFAQVGHVHAHVMGVFGVARAPYQLEQLLVRDDTVGLRRQLREQLVFDGRQVKQLSTALDGSAGQVHHHITKRDEGRAATRALGLLLLAAAQLGAHPGRQLARTKGFDEVVVGTGIERSDFAGLGAAGREHDDGHA